MQDHEPGPEANEPSETAARSEETVIVLPWWQHPLNIITIVVTIAIVAGVIGWFVGDAAAEPDTSEVDIGFLQDMREHHEQAVGLANLFLDLEGTQPGLRTVARSVVMGQSIDIGRMIQLLREFGASEVNEGDTSMTWMGMSSARGSMPGSPTPEQIELLAGSSGAEADEVFIALMTAHHLGALDMAVFATQNARDDEVRAMAASMAGAQRAEIIELQGLRQ